MDELSGDRFSFNASASTLDGASDAPRVLIVEDDELTRTALSLLARREGYEIRAVANGAAALIEARTFRPDIILLDLYMPVMDGFEFMERLTAEVGRGRTKVIVLSAADRLDLVHVRLGADAYISKPFDAERLRAALTRLAIQARRKRL
jgi:CheY-like chemotaxis protein